MALKLIYTLYPFSGLSIGRGARGSCPFPVLKLKEMKLIIYPMPLDYPDIDPSCPPPKKKKCWRFTPAPFHLQTILGTPSQLTVLSKTIAKVLIKLLVLELKRCLIFFCWPATHPLKILRTPKGYVSRDAIGTLK